MDSYYTNLKYIEHFLLRHQVRIDEVIYYNVVEA